MQTNTYFRQAYEVKEKEECLRKKGWKQVWVLPMNRRCGILPSEESEEEEPGCQKVGSESTVTRHSSFGDCIINASKGYRNSRTEKSQQFRSERQNQAQ